MDRDKKYTAIVQKSKLEYTAACLELNIIARGKDVEEVKMNIGKAIDLYLDETADQTETFDSAMSSEELIDFLHDTDSTRDEEPARYFML